MALTERIQKLLEELDRGLIERKGIVRLAFLAILTGQPTYLYGRAGSGKRALIHHLLDGFKDLKTQTYGSRSYILPKDPIDLAIFSSFDSGFPPMVNAINAFLEDRLAGELILSGRIRPDVALSEAHISDSIHLVLSLPDSVSPDALETLLSKAGDPLQYSVSEDLKISTEEIKSWRKKIETINISKDSFTLLKAIAAECEKSNIYISAKRWRGFAKMARMQAFLAGRSETNVTDFLFLSEDLWGKRGINEAINKGFNDGMIAFLDTYAQDPSELRAATKDLLIRAEHFKNASGNRYKTTTIDGEEYCSYSITVFNEPITLFAPLSRIGTNEDFFPLNALHREETRAKCNYMGGDVCKISIDSKAKRNGMRASSIITNSQQSSSSINTVYEDYAKLPSEILQINDTEIMERNKVGLQNAHEQLFDVITQALQNIKNLKALYQKNSAYQNDPCLLTTTYKTFMNFILHRYRAFGEFSRELQQYETVLEQASTGIKN